MTQYSWCKTNAERRSSVHILIGVKPREKSKRVNVPYHKVLRFITHNQQNENGSAKLNIKKLRKLGSLLSSDLAKTRVASTMMSSTWPAISIEYHTIWISRGWEPSAKPSVDIASNRGERLFEGRVRGVEAEARNGPEFQDGELNLRASQRVFIDDGNWKWNLGVEKKTSGRWDFS